ncbi:eukaryotic aspartyl protease family protein isoform X5 [Wolffia australiana]
MDTVRRAVYKLRQGPSSAVQANQGQASPLRRPSLRGFLRRGESLQVAGGAVRLRGGVRRPRLLPGSARPRRLLHPLRQRLSSPPSYRLRELQGKSAPTDGVLGLGSGGAGALAQLSAQGLARNVVGHCLSRSGGGFLFFGGDLFPATGFSWVDASSRGHYSPGKADLFLGTKLFSKRQPIVLDTGSSYTYLSSRPYSSFLRLLEEGLAVAPLEEAAGDGALPLCWRGKRPFKSLDEAAKFFKPLTLVFFKKVLLEIPPRGYLVLSKLGNVCLGILNGTHVGLNDYNIIGDISMLDLLVVYDNEKKRIGWARADCSRLLNVNGDDGFDSGSIWSMLQSRDGFTHRLLNRL